MGSLAPRPVFYTPGDNEWTDCDRFVDEATGVRYSDLDRLARVRALFFAEPVAAPEALAYRRQEAQPENATWTHGNVRFLTLHVVGTNNGRDWVTGDPLERAREAVAARDAANLAWLADGFEAAAKDRSAAVIIAMQADMTDVKDKPEDEMCTDVASSDDHPCDAFVALRRALADNARGFAGPVLLIHGDTAPFTLNQKIAGEEAKNLWRLNAAGDAGVGRTGFPYGVRDATLVTFDPSVDKPFSARGLVTGKQPKRR